MALAAGSISVNSGTGAHTGSGMSFAILDAWWPTVAGNYDEAHIPDEATRISTIVAVKNGIKNLLQAIADGVIGEITSNAVVTVTVTTSTSGLQNLPNPPTAGSLTVAPLVPVDLTGTVA